MPHGDRDGMPTRINEHVNAVAPPIGELGACVANPDRVERALQVARWICQRKAAYGPKHANGWQECRDARAYADHINAVAFVELQNAGTLAMLCETIEALQKNIDTDNADRRASRDVALNQLLAMVGGPWRIGDKEIADRGDGVAKPFESWRAWSQRMTRLPNCYPPKGYIPPTVKPPEPEPTRGSYGGPVRFDRGGRR